MDSDPNMCLAIPTRVLTVEGNSATVDVQGVRARVRLDALGEQVRIGDYLLVHAGFAIRRLDPEDAQETLALLDELFALDGPLPPVRLPPPSDGRGGGEGNPDQSRTSRPKLPGEEGAR